MNISLAKAQSRHYLTFAPFASLREELRGVFVSAAYFGFQVITSWRPRAFPMTFSHDQAKAIVEIQEEGVQRGFERFVEVLEH